MELVVKHASKACAERRVGSSPTLETMTVDGKFKPTGKNPMLMTRKRCNDGRHDIG
jgi:hypothetical protein